MVALYCTSVTNCGEKIGTSKAVTVADEEKTPVHPLKKASKNLNSTVVLHAKVVREDSHCCPTGLVTECESCNEPIEVVDV